MKKPLAWLGGALVAGYIASTSLVPVGETELVMITQFGSPVRVVDRAGLTFKMPDPVQSTLRLDRRLQLVDADPGEFLTRDKKNIVISTFVLWRVQNAEKFLQSVRDPLGAQRRLLDLAGSELGAAIGNEPLSAFLNTGPEGTRLPAIMAGVTEKCRGQAKSEFGIEIVDIRVRRLSFPSQNLLAVYDRMRAEREAIAKQYRAEGEEAAANIRSQTDKEVRELLATAYREAQTAKGKGEAESIGIYASAFRKDPEFYKLTRTLEAYQKLMDDRTTLVLSAQSPLFKYLEAPPK
jgi:modulator of FtsH protease HflC